MEIEKVLVKTENFDDDFCTIVENEKETGDCMDIESINEMPFKCGICGHRTTTDTLLKVHMKMHLVKRIHQCNICKRTFSFVTELNSHILTHSDGKISSHCEICDKDFFTEEDLHKHYRIHTKEKPFRCKSCFRAFSNVSYLRVHERSHHGGEDYLKKKMLKDGTFVDPSVVKNLNEEEKPKAFQCTICQKYFSDEGFFNLHSDLHLNKELQQNNITTKETLSKIASITNVSDKYLENCRTTLPVEETNPSCFECVYIDEDGKKCLRRFGDEEAFGVHLKTHEGVDGQMLCDLCKSYYPGYLAWFEHMEATHGNYHTASDSGVDDHHSNSKEIAKGKEKTVFKCTVCAKCFPVPSKLRSHMRSHTGEKPFKCEICLKSFGSAGSLKDHSYLHSSERPFQCTICKKGFTKNSALEDHIRTHTGEKPYECNICKKKYTTLVILNQHLLAHAKEKPFKCDVCNKSFIYLCNLKYHMVTHTGSKPFACNLCDKSYALKSALKMHMMDHTGKKPHKCKFCCKEFTTVSSLKKHERVHTGEKPYLCTICKRGFSQTSSLSRHMDSHSGEKPYVCPICKKGLTSASYLKVHMKIHNGESPYQCNFCGKPFRVVLKYRNHLKEHKSEEYRKNEKKDKHESQLVKLEIEDKHEVKNEIVNDTLEDLGIKMEVE